VADEHHPNRHQSGAKLRLEQAFKEGLRYVHIALDLENAYNSYSRRDCQDAIEEGRQYGHTTPTAGKRATSSCEQADASGSLTNSNTSAAASLADHKEVRSPTRLIL
jgi:hypothetical protein